MTSGDQDSFAVEHPDDTVASFEEEGNHFANQVRNWLHQTPAAVPLIVLVISTIVFGLVLGAKFFSPFALTLILQQVAIVGIVALAQSLVILTAGIDLSVGAIMVFSSVIMGQFTFRYGLPVEVSVFCGLFAGTLMGAINGILVAIVRLPPFIVTLGTWQIFLAANFLYSENETIRGSDIADQAPLLQFFGEKFKIGGAVFTYGVVLMLLLAVVLAYMLRFTAWGRHVYAVGDDPDAAELSGVRTKRVLISVYALSGLICAVAGWVLIGPYRVGLANLRAIGQYRGNNGGGDWRYFAVRRPRFHSGLTLRRVDCRRVFTGFAYGWHRPAMDLFTDRIADYSCCWH